MAISRIQAVSSATSTVTLTSTTAGDFVLLWAFNASASTLPTAPAGYTLIIGNTNVQCAARIFYRISPGGETSIGAVTNATTLACQVYRGVSGWGQTPTVAGGNTAILLYNAVNMTYTNGTSWVAAFGGSAGVTAGMNGTPTGTAPNLVNQTSQTKVNGLDTNTPVNSYTQQSLTVTGSGRWQATTIELVVPRRVFLTSC